MNISSLYFLLVVGSVWVYHQRYHYLCNSNHCWMFVLNVDCKRLGYGKWWRQLRVRLASKSIQSKSSPQSLRSASCFGRRGSDGISLLQCHCGWSHKGESSSLSLNSYKFTFRQVSEEGIAVGILDNWDALMWNRGCGKYLIDQQNKRDWCRELEAIEVSVS